MSESEICRVDQGRGLFSVFAGAPRADLLVCGVKRRVPFPVSAGSKVSSPIRSLKDETQRAQHCGWSLCLPRASTADRDGAGAVISTTATGAGIARLIGGACWVPGRDGR